jgi:hypothetical protein
VNLKPQSAHLKMRMLIILLVAALSTFNVWCQNQKDFNVPSKIKFVIKIAFSFLGSQLDVVRSMIGATKFLIIKTLSVWPPFQCTDMT